MLVGSEAPRLSGSVSCVLPRSSAPGGFTTLSKSLDLGVFNLEILCCLGKMSIYLKSASKTELKWEARLSYWKLPSFQKCV